MVYLSYFTGLCYDVVNNLIWMVSNDWVDQFYNNGHQALHRILTRLGLDHPQSCDVHDGEYGL